VVRTGGFDIEFASFDCVGSRIDILLDRDAEPMFLKQDESAVP